MSEFDGPWKLIAQLRADVDRLRADVDAMRDHWRRVADSVAPVDLFRESGGSLPDPLPAEGPKLAKMWDGSFAYPPVLNRSGDLAERRKCPHCGRDFLSIASGGSETCINCGRWIDAPTLNKSGGCASVSEYSGGRCQKPDGHDGMHEDDRTRWEGR